MSRIFRLTIFLSLLCLALSQAALGQQLRISGTVSDITGVIPGATVTLRDPAGATTEAVTNDAGQYAFESLAAGAYEIMAAREGFLSATRTLALVAEPRTVDVTLEVAGVSTSVEVTDVAGRATAAGMDIPNLELPSYVATVPARVLQEQGINDLPAALENVSGVMTQVQYGVYEWYTIGGITQQSGNDFLYVDGVTLTGNRSFTQLNNIEEVQVLKGPNSILYGGSGSGQGGMVNLIRKKPQSVPVSDIQYRLGRWGKHEITVGTAGPLFGLGQLMYRVDASYSTRDGWRDTGAKRFNVSPSITWLITSRMRITANQALIRDRYTLDAGVRSELVSRLGGFPFDRKMNPGGDFQLTRDWQNQIIYSWTPTDRLTISNTFFMRRNRDQYLDAETMTYVPATDQVTRAYLYFQHNRRPAQDLADVTGDYNIGGMRHRFLGRYEFSNQHNFTNRTGNAPGTSNNLALPLPSVPVPAFIAGTWVDTAPEYTNFPITRVDYSTNRYHGLVFQDQVNPVRWLGINLTVSRRMYRRDTHNDSFDNGRFIAPGPVTVIENNTKNNYRAGFALIPQETWAPLIRGFQPYFSYNSSFNPVNQVQASGVPLDPVLNKSFEIGNKWQGLNNRLTILTAVRRIRDKNRVINLGNQIFEQVGMTTTYNGDLDIQGNVGGGVWVVANWGYADSRIENLRSDGLPQANAGKRFPHAPKHTARLWLTKTFQIRSGTSLSVSLGNRYVGRYFANATNTTMVPSRGTMDGAVNLRRGKYDVAVNLANILNKQHYFVSQINGGGLLYPGEPFNAAVTIRYRFQ